LAPLAYLTLRVVRRCLPAGLVRLLMRQRILIRPGMETRDPAAAIRRFREAIDAAGETVVGRRILIFGYGGHLDVARELLSAGARHVVLLDPHVEPAPLPSPLASDVTVVHAPLSQYISRNGEPVDLVLSNSVMEHVKDVGAAVAELARITTPSGLHLHFIDLRDHFFKYPFEMLCHSDSSWRRFLNPGSNLNRLRVWDYDHLFSLHFQRVNIQVLASEIIAFRSVRSRIRPEFLSGDETRDAITQILLRAARPAATKTERT
jgi:SAM-dependent methyltransferase